LTYALDSQRASDYVRTASTVESTETHAAGTFAFMNPFARGKFKDINIKVYGEYTTGSFELPASRTENARFRTDFLEARSSKLEAT